MPDVIDLVSSSPELPARATKNVEILAPPQPAPPSKALNYEAPKRKNDDFHTLSSDGVDVDIFLPPPKPAPKASNTSTEPKASSTTTSKPPHSTTTSEASNGIFFRSDDFDSTIVLDDDDPFASDPPPAKKPRLSPPSNPSIITRSPEYHVWISKLEKSANSVSYAVSSKQPTTNASRSDTGASTKLTAPSPIPGSSRGIAPRASTYKKSASDIGASSKSAAPRTSNSELMRSKTMSTAMESDPILLTSSPDAVADARKRKEKHAKERINHMLADSSDDDIFDLSPRKDNKGKAKSTASALAISERGITLRNFEFEPSDFDLPDLGAIPSQSVAKTVAKSKAKSKAKGKSAAMTALERYDAEKAKEKKRMEKAQKAKNKSAALEAEKDKKRMAKEEKAREKDRAADLAKVNTLRTDKKKSTPEMIVDLPSCLDTRLAEQIQTFLKPVEAQHAAYENMQPIIKWRRKIDSEFDKEADHWENVESYIGREKHVMCIMKAQEFVDLATGEEGKDLDSHVLRLKAKVATNEIIYLIEGLEPWIRKNKNLQNRKYVQEVRSQIPEETTGPTASQRRKKKPEMEHVDEDLVEDVLLKLQVVHGVLIHHTKVQIETAEWVVIFTQHISTVRYRVQKQSLDTNFCMESGQVKTGDGPVDTFTKMLQEMVRVTAPIAYGIAAQYPTVQKLVKGLKDNGPLALQDCKKSANKDGAFTDRRVGPSISKRVYNVFICRDTGTYDV